MIKHEKKRKNGANDDTEFKLGELKIDFLF